MSLTDQLTNNNSPVKKWWAIHAKPAAEQYVVQCNRRIKERMKSKQTIFFPGSEADVVGMAFGRYLLPWIMGPFEPEETMAYIGSARKNRSNIVEGVIRYGNKYPQYQTVLSIILADFERDMRSGFTDIKSEYYLDEPLKGIQKHIERIVTRREATIKDMKALRDVVITQSMPQVRQRILSPSFSGSDDVGGADAKMIVNETILDTICSANAVPFDSRNFQKVIFYALLDYDNEYSINALSWYMPRQSCAFNYKLETACNEFFEMSIADTRQSLKEYLKSTAQDATRRFR